MYIIYQVKSHEIAITQLYFDQENQLFHIVQPNTTSPAMNVRSLNLRSCSSLS